MNKTRALFILTVAILTGALVIVGWPWYVALPVSWLAMLGAFRLHVSV